MSAERIESNHPDWDVLEYDDVQRLIKASPDGLLHARISPARDTLCRESGDRGLLGPRTYVAKILRMPDPLRLEVTCPDCYSWMHS